MMFSSYSLAICLTLLRGVGTGGLGLYVLDAGTGLVSSTTMILGFFFSCFRSNLISSDLLSFFKLALFISI